MKCLTAMMMLAAVPFWAPGAAVAGDRIAVPLPDVSRLSRDEAKSLLAELAQIDVITAACPGYEISEAEWVLIAGTGDMIAARLGLDPKRYERRYYGPAFGLLDDPDACERIGPTARPMIARLIKMGGKPDHGS